MAYAEPSQTSNMGLFVKIVTSFKPLTIFVKRPVLDVWLGCECDSEFPTFIKKSYSLGSVPFRYQSSNFTVDNDGLHMTYQHQSKVFETCF